jgi:hypothetical protein
MHISLFFHQVAKNHKKPALFTPFFARSVLFGVSSGSNFEWVTMDVLKPKMEVFEKLGGGGLMITYVINR